MSINTQRIYIHLRERWYFFIPAIFVCVVGLIPLGYLIGSAFDFENTNLVENLFRWRNARLFLNTLLLMVGVLVVDVLLTTPAAWLTTYSDLHGKRIFSVLCALPLAIPGYVMAYALLGIGGNNGIFAILFGKSIPRLNGYWGALVALSFYTSPYLFLNLRSAFLGLDPNLEESARSLGCNRWGVFFRVILPQLRPAYYAAGLLICLHVLGDFGVVSLMQYETFSQALYIEYKVVYDHSYASWLALMLLAFTGLLLFIEIRLLSDVLLHRAGHGTSRYRTLVSLGRWKGAGYGFMCLLFVVTVCIPATTVVLWMFRGVEPSALDGLWVAVVGSVRVAVPTALCCGILAVPFAYIGVRLFSRSAAMLSRIPYFIYAVPPLAFALSIIFCVGSRETILVLICACVLHFLAEATGPVRSSIYQTSPHLEEAARSLGCSPIEAFFRTLFPLLVRGMLVAMALVFLATMKELPLTLLLRPPEFETLAANVWDYTEDAMFSNAAPYAFLILVFSGIFVGLLIRREET